MIEVFFVACMAAAPAECNEQRLILGDVSLAVCQTLAQPELARWMENHPDLDIKRWQCRRMS